MALYMAAMVLTLLAYHRVPEDKRLFHLPPPKWDLTGLLSLLVASLPALVASGLLVLRWDSLPAAVSLYTCSLGLLAAFCARREGLALPRLQVLKEHWLELTLVTMVLGFGLFLRLHRLDYYPPPGGISWNDEAQMGKDAYGIIHYGYLAWQFLVSVYSSYVSFLVLEPTVLALRLPFVLWGFATLVVFYLLARELFRFQIALAVTFLFAVSRWHLAFTRLVLPCTPAMLLEVSTFFLLLRGRRTGGMTNYILAGLTISLGLYSHASFRIVPILVCLLFIGELWSARRALGQAASVSCSLASRWAVFVVSMIVFASPLLPIVGREPHRAFGERFAAVMPAIFGGDKGSYWEGLWPRAQQVLGFFNYRGEAWGAVNLPDLPMLDPWTGLLFALGFAYCLFYFWRSRHLFFLGWLVITLVGGGLLTVDFRSHRFAGVMPVLFIFAGVFVDGAWAGFRRAFGSSRDKYFALLLLPVLVLAGYANYDIFFYRQIRANSVRLEFTREISAIANYMVSLGEGHYFYLFANHNYYNPGMDFAWMAGEPPGERALDVLDVIPSHRDTGDEELVYIISTPYDVQALSEVVSHFYPEAQIETHQGKYERYTFVSVRVRSEVAQGARGLRGRYYAGHDHSRGPELVRQDAWLSFDWSVEEPPVPFPFQAEWRGTIYAPHYAAYAFETEATGRAQAYVDEERVERGQPITLDKGWHRLRVTYASAEDEGALKLLWTTRQRGREVIPPEFLSPREDVDGLLVTVYEGPDWSGTPVQQSIEPVLSLFRMPSAWQSAPVAELAGKLHSLDCRGQVKVERAGVCGFQIVAWNGRAILHIDGEELARAVGGRTTTGRGEVELSPGWHDVRLRYSYGGGEFSGVELLWAPGGGEMRVVPPEALRFVS